MQEELYTRVAAKLREGNLTKKSAVVGLDGFIDRITYPVRERKGPDEYTPIETLTEYGQKFIDCAGLSTNVEMVTVREKLGGVGAILANSLANLGMELTYIGAMGSDQISPVFRDFARKASIISIANPATSDAIEFQDGKIISSQLEALKDVNWENLRKHCSIDELIRLYSEADFYAFANWTMAINAETIWTGLLEEVFPHLPATKRRFFLFDLSDPAKRTDEDLLRALRIMEKYEEYFAVTLGLNEKEARDVSRRLGNSAWDTAEPLDIARFIKSKLNLTTIVVHPVKQACAVRDNEEAIVDGPYCPNPRLTTGAGDNFNAGYVTGQMLGMNLEESLLLGTANSGYYVRAADSANFDQLTEFVELKARGGDVEELCAKAETAR